LFGTEIFGFCDINDDFFEQHCLGYDAIKRRNPPERNGQVRAQNVKVAGKRTIRKEFNMKKLGYKLPRSSNNLNIFPKIRL